MWITVDSVHDPWTKLFRRITESSLWQSDDATVRVWITMLAHADKDGFVLGSAVRLSIKSHVPLGKVEQALAVFLGPDAYSSTAAHEGRRIEEFTQPNGDKGWVLLNHGKFMKLMSEDHRREYWRDWKAGSRSKAKQVRKAPGDDSGNGKGKTIAQWTKDESGGLPEKQREESQEMLRKIEEENSSDL